MILTKKPQRGVAEISTLLKFRLGVLGDFPLTSWQWGGYFFEEREKMTAQCLACDFNPDLVITMVIPTNLLS